MRESISHLSLLVSSFYSVIPPAPCPSVCIFELVCSGKQWQIFGRRRRSNRITHRRIYLCARNWLKSKINPVLEIIDVVVVVVVVFAYNFPWIRPDDVEKNLFVWGAREFIGLKTGGPTNQYWSRALVYLPNSKNRIS